MSGPGSTGWSADPIECGLPHRPPFVFVDRVTVLEAGKRACGTKCFSPEEPFFQGHFPGDPLVPGVILSEALAQVAGLVVQRPGLRLAAIRSMKFLAPVRPGETIELAAEQTGTRRGESGALWLFSAVATVGGRPVAEGMLVLAEG
ncbi:MAG TPA: 3-hydroxyacyl-ACP dehydratase FabZ family protein [Chthoniobacteraceae bacterium]|nr:3-hydroxyacyl-ACP dehydratase FabZ family protein [Chthoniobacteraceae bacterium]